MNDYERIERVIRYIDERREEQPDLTELAALLQLSPSHFHRLFSSWAGITPKDFLQCLTLEYSKALLHRGKSILAAAFEAGLSGPGRLHDLYLTLEAVSPGEFKSGGAGCDIRYGLAPTPFGLWLAAETERGICHISFLDGGSATAGIEELAQDWPKARLTRDDDAALRLARRVFQNQPGEKAPLRAFVRGTSFQVQVWRALLRIPPGALTSYGRLAAAVGKPSAARAVGAAVGSNPVAYLIPCHRVIRETGVVREYRWGPERKRAMVAWESRLGGGATLGPVDADEPWIGGKQGK